MNLSCLPDEIKLIIISYLPISKLLASEPLPIFNEYIMYYINTQLLKDMYKSGYLYKSPIYSDIIYDKINQIAENIAQGFIKEITNIGGPTSVNSVSTKIISLRIKFTFTRVGRYFQGSTDDFMYSLSTYGISENSCTWMYNNFQYGFQYSDENIKNEIWRILIKNMDHSDTTIDIKSMELIKTDIFDEKNNIVLIKFI